MSDINYNFHGMSEMSGDIRNRVAALNETHDELKGYVNRLADAWESEQAKTAYDAVQRDWDTAHADLINVLQMIAKTVEDGTANMQDAELRNAAMW